jgi:hypothetical protein
VDRFPGDPDAVEIDESIPGMDMQMDHGGGSMGDMNHGGHH